MLGVVADEATHGAVRAPFEVADANWDGVQVFLASGTQWRVGMGGATGLDYTAVRAVMGLLGVTDERSCFWRVQVLEQQMLDHWERRSQQRAPRNKTKR